MLVPLIQEIRDFLHDPDGDRWSDNRILYYIDKAQKDLVNKTRCLHSTINIGLRETIDLVTLPDDLLDVKRVSLNGCKIDLVSHDTLDSKEPDCSSCWEGKRGTPCYAIVDKTDRHRLRLHPIPDKGSDTLYQEISLGLFADLGDDKYGVITDNLTTHTELVGYGTTTDILLDDLVLEIHYDRKPKYIDSIDNTLEVDDIYTQAIKYYVCGQLLRSDKDSNSRSLGNEELKLYLIELKQLKKDSQSNFASGGVRLTTYRRF